MTPFQLTMPEKWTTCAIFASPHSGRQYPEEFLQQSVLCQSEIRSSEDAFVDELFSAAPRFGAPMIQATLPRAYVDLNRDRDELDPAVIRGAVSTRSNPRVASGLGVVPRVVANGRAIYRGKISMEAAKERLRNVWDPYHVELGRLTNQCVANFGNCLLVDCHSMPHEALSAVSSARATPEIVLGDRYGTTSAPEFMEVAEAAFSAAGFVVARNAPFAGAFTTQRYGHPARNRHAIQVEVDRSTYMDEETLERRLDFVEVRRAITQAIGEISIYCQRPAIPLAAE